MCHSETVLAEMGVALREDSTLVGVFSPRKVEIYLFICCCDKLVVFTVLKNQLFLYFSHACVSLSVGSDLIIIDRPRF